MFDLLVHKLPDPVKISLHRLPIVGVVKRHHVVKRSEKFLSGLGIRIVNPGGRHIPLSGDITDRRFLEEVALQKLKAPHSVLS